MDMRVEERGKHHPALGVDHLGVARLDAPGGGKLRDLALSHHDVVGAVEAGPWVEHGSAAQDEVTRRLSAAPPVERGHGAKGRTHAGSLIGVGAPMSSGSPVRPPSGRGRPPARSS